MRTGLKTHELDQFQLRISDQSLYRELLYRVTPDPITLASLISKYAQKKFTYLGDVLRAFAGIATALSSSFNQGFICGLPVAFFRIALLWKYQTPCARNQFEPLQKQTCLPSWSWAGWRGGKLDLGRWNAAMDFIKYKHSSNNTPPDCVQPLVQWQHHLTPKSSGVPISCNWRINRDRYLHTAEGLPSGWERHSIDPSPLPSEASDVDGSDFVFDYSKSTPKCFYTHRNAPDEQFWYPLPLPDPEDPFTNPIYAPFISSRTRRARLFLAERLTTDQKGRNNSNRPPNPNELPPCGATLSEFSSSIRDGKGSWAGVLLPNKEPPPEWTHSANETVELELVEISLVGEHTK